MQKDSFDIYACQRQCRFFLSVCWLDILLNDTSDLVAKKRTFPDDRITSWLKLQVQINFLCIFGLPCVLNMWVCLKKLHYQILFIVLVKCYQQCSALMLSQCKNTLLSVIFQRKEFNLWIFRFSMLHPITSTKSIFRCD